MKDCKFCQIVRGELPSSRVFENTLVYALLDVNPINPGHTIVIPRRHVCAFTDLNPQEIGQLALIGQRVASALKASFPHCEGISLSLADGEAADQEVPHTHLHVIPRRTGDGFGWRRYGNVQDRSELDALAARIRSVLDIDIETN
ncbi:MAG: HIT family protein [Anaerolineae bacterium]|nr:HIT family protein [Anaerolineae bacterium]